MKLLSQNNNVNIAITVPNINTSKSNQELVKKKECLVDI